MSLSPSVAVEPAIAGPIGDDLLAHLRRVGRALRNGEAITDGDALIFILHAGDHFDELAERRLSDRAPPVMTPPVPPAGNVLPFRGGH